MKRIQTVKIQMVKDHTALYEVNTVNSPYDAYKIMVDFMKGLDREMLCVMCLDTKNKVNAINIVSVGSLNSSIVHPREVFKAAILANSNAIILAHNHPSGDSTPSEEDITITKRMIDAGEILGIQVLDHVIIGEEKHVSLKEKGII